MADPLALTRRFIDCINRHDVAGLEALMTEDHTFVDIPGGRHRGRDHMALAWKGYFAMFPDYEIRVSEIREASDTVTVLGNSVGRLSDYGRGILSIAGKVAVEGDLNGPAIWTARFDGDLIREWRILEDTPETRTVLGLRP